MHTPVSWPSAPKLRRNRGDCGGTDRHAARRRPQKAGKALADGAAARAATQITGVVLSPPGAPTGHRPFKRYCHIGIPTVWGTLDVARQAGFDQLILTWAVRRPAVRAAMALDRDRRGGRRDVERGTHCGIAAPSRWHGCIRRPQDRR